MMTFLENIGYYFAGLLGFLLVMNEIRKCRKWINYKRSYYGGMNNIKDIGNIKKNVTN